MTRLLPVCVFYQFSKKGQTDLVLSDHQTRFKYCISFIFRAGFNLTKCSNRGYPSYIYTIQNNFYQKIHFLKKLDCAANHKMMGAYTFTMKVCQQENSAQLILLTAEKDQVTLNNSWQFQSFIEFNLCPKTVKRVPKPFNIKC